jgi:hypothetical protein
VKAQRTIAGDDASWIPLDDETTPIFRDGRSGGARPPKITRMKELSCSHDYGIFL